MIEEIGKVKLNLDNYIGKDLYSDGDIEDRLLEIVKNNPKEKYDEIIVKEASWPLLYHLSELRENILNWYPFNKNTKILEIGAGCGAVTGAMLNKGSSIISLDLSKRRSLINAYRHKDCDDLEIIVGNFNDVAEKIEQKFDYITLIGVFEYAETYMQCKNPYIVFLDKINKLLNDNGKILMAIENRLGLKYFAGCKEDHVGKYFEGIENYKNTQGVHTFSKFELEKILKDYGFNDYNFYYPYPDYKFPNKIFSDEHLPKDGELSNNIRNFDGDRIVAFDETKAFEGIIKANLFDEFSNSFFVEISKKVG